MELPQAFIILLFSPASRVPHTLFSTASRVPQYQDSTAACSAARNCATSAGWLLATFTEYAS